MRKRLAGSLRLRILAYVILVCGVGTGITLTTVIVSMYDHLIERSKNEIVTNVESAAKEIERNNEAAVLTATAMAEAQESGMFGMREQTVEYLRSMLMRNTGLFDTYVIYEPNADGQDARFAGTRWHDSTGRFNAVWNNIDGKPVWTHGVDMETSMYYDGVRRSVIAGSPNATMITEPYMYEGVMMVEHTAPIMINGRFAGIAGCDRLLGEITRYLENTRPYETVDFLLVSRLGGIVVSTRDSSLLTRKYTDIEQRDILTALMQNNSADRVLRFTDPVADEDFYFAAAPIRTGEWTLFMRVSHAELAAPIIQTIWTIIIICSGLFVLLVAVLIWLVNSIVRPIAVAADSAHRVAEGDLTVAVSSDSADETGMLIRAIQNMTGSLNTIVQQVQKTGVRVVSSATEIFASTKNLQSIASEQYDFANQVLAATRQIAATAGALSATMESVRVVSEQAKDSALSSRGYLDRMEHVTGQMLQASRTISQKLGVISDKAGNISKITTTINKISDQINILSINAAIEAEKAGEYGKGFSIVSREIRRLSDQTTEGTFDIESLINSMQTAVSLGVTEMDKFMLEVNSGVVELANVNEAIENIVMQVQDLAPRFGDVSDSMAQQIQGVEHINDSVTRLTQGAKQIEDSLTEFITVTSELKEEAEALKNQIAHFRLKG